eukprot:711595_1
MSELYMDDIDKHWLHIHQWHVIKGNRHTIENTFQFFNKAIHYEDTDKKISECMSVRRRDTRHEQMARQNVEHPSILNPSTTHRGSIGPLHEEILIYKQTQLDTYHSYLVHTDWKEILQRHINELDNESDVASEESKHDDHDVANTATEQLLEPVFDDKYASFGFGVHHSHVDLQPQVDESGKWITPSIYDEIVYSEEWQVDNRVFYAELIKAIRKRSSLVSGDMKEDWPCCCKHFDPKFNIIRGEFIGIRHVLAIVMYTDLSNFCKKFRETYRKNKDETKEELQSRHCQLYHYARSLFESVEFFGQYMARKQTLYHGLSIVLPFSKYTKKFDQPISTTTSKTKARQFSQGNGVVLFLKSAVKDVDADDDDDSLRSKYLSVRLLSQFPEEEERLFYGATFEIKDIMEVKTNTPHTKELKMYNTPHTKELKMYN